MDGVNATGGDGSYGEESNGKHGAFDVVLTMRSCGRLVDAGVDERQQIDGEHRRVEVEEGGRSRAWRRPRLTWALETTWSTTGKQTSKFLGRGELGVHKDDENHGGGGSVARGREEGK
ncbi:hypothetical protein TRIUR3_29923 [Triticum urartu]|uniref:Uncharacterized protein n=1 Tax=Triticum urartu TaxID=4572 RepID=M7Z532_TRIUA|nr:hypothetical protein TRIUR3_29923 [Triticum urartu]